MRITPYMERDTSSPEKAVSNGPSNNFTAAQLPLPVVKIVALGSAEFAEAYKCASKRNSPPVHVLAKATDDARLYQKETQANFRIEDILRFRLGQILQLSDHRGVIAKSFADSPDKQRITCFEVDALAVNPATSVPEILFEFKTCHGNIGKTRRRAKLQTNGHAEALKNLNPEIKSVIFLIPVSGQVIFPQSSTNSIVINDLNKLTADLIYSAVAEREFSAVFLFSAANLDEFYKQHERKINSFRPNVERLPLNPKKRLTGPAWNALNDIKLTC